MLTDKNHKSYLWRPVEKIFGIQSPYNWVESLGWNKRDKSGADAIHGVRVPYLPKDCLVNDGVLEEVTLGFVGDILDTKGLPAKTTPEVTAFFEDCDAIICNFESTITNLPGHKTATRHIRGIIDTLLSAFPPSKTYLSIANNHAGDFPLAVFRESIHLLEQNGYTVFGDTDRPFVDIVGPTRIITGTDWSNASNEHVAMLEKGPTCALRKPDAYNVLFPHWGYELELYPRKSMLRKSAEWSDGFQAIMAHHGHTPRAIYALDRTADQPRVLIADSLGDFTCGIVARWYNFGMLAKIGLGRDAKGRRAVGRLRWEFSQTLPQNGVVEVSVVPNFPLLPAEEQA